MWCFSQVKVVNVVSLWFVANILNPILTLCKFAKNLIMMIFLAVPSRDGQWRVITLLFFKLLNLKSLQLIQNGSTRVLTHARRAYFSPVSFYIGSNSRSKSRIKSEILLKILNIQTPSYLKELIVPYHHNRSLHSQTAGSPVVPKIFKSRMWDRAFSFKALEEELPIWIWKTDPF